MAFAFASSTIVMPFLVTYDHTIFIASNLYGDEAWTLPSMVMEEEKQAYLSAMVCHMVVYKMWALPASCMYPYDTKENMH